MSKFMFSKQNVLVSYAYLRKNVYLQELVLACSPYVNFLIDSGAFTDRWSTFRSHATGKKYEPISLGEYIEFCGKFSGKVWQYIALDVIRNPKKTLENLSEMVKSGLKPMPVYVEGFNTGNLNQLLSVNDRICVAGAIGADIAYVHKRYDDVFKASNGVAKIHALGYGRYPEIKSASIYTADSSSATTGERYGAMFIFDEVTGMKTTGYKKLAAMQSHSKYISYIKDRFGVPIEIIKNRDYYISKEKYSLPTAVSYHSYMLMAEASKKANSPKNYFQALTIPKAILVQASIAKNVTSNGVDYFAFRDDCHKYHTRGDKQLGFIVESFNKHTDWKKDNI